MKKAYKDWFLKEHILRYRAHYLELIPSPAVFVIDGKPVFFWGRG